jgi:hypothetical protein
MKIEFTCLHCHSVLRLPAEHAGKRARCPVCSALVMVPIDVASGSASPLGPVAGDGLQAWGNHRSPDEVIQSEPLAKPVDSSSETVGGDLDNMSAGQRIVTPRAQFEPAQGWPVPTNPYAAPQQSPTGDFPPSPVPMYPPTDGLWVTGLVLGISSIFVQCACCWLGTVIALPMSFVGLGCTYFSSSRNRWVGFLLNGLAMLISLLVIGFFLAVVIMDGQF